MKLPHLSPLAVIAICTVVAVFGGAILALANFRMHAETRQHVAVVAKVATKAEHLAQRDAALIYAICGELRQRDAIETHFDGAIAEVAKQYASPTNAYATHVRPLFRARNLAYSKLASADCQRLMQRAVTNAPIPTAMPIVAGTPF